MDLPILFKPTYLNMSSDFENLNFADFLYNGSLNTSLIHNIFGYNLDWEWINNIRFDFTSQKFWVWGPHFLRATIASAVYDFLVSSDPNPWPGWNYIWKLCVLPRIKTFVQKLAHGKLPTGDDFYGLDIDPFTQCHFCGLVSESASHIFWNYCKIVPCWNTLCATFNLDSIILNELSSGCWLTQRYTFKNSNAFFKALIATIAWIIWKDRCNLVFKGWAPKYHTIFSRAWSYCLNFFNSTGNNIREYSDFFCPWKTINLYTDASWTDSPAGCGLGFIAITNTG